MNPRTKEHLITAMHGEAFAYVKYMLFAARASKNGNRAIAELFEKTAAVERLKHFAEEAELLGLIGTDVANLRDAIAGESYEVETMYRDFAAEASADGDYPTAARFEEIRNDEADHRLAFEEALKRCESEPLKSDRSVTSIVEGL